MCSESDLSEGPLRFSFDTGFSDARNVGQHFLNCSLLSSGSPRPDSRNELPSGINFREDLDLLGHEQTFSDHGFSAGSMPLESPGQSDGMCPPRAMKHADLL